MLEGLFELSEWNWVPNEEEVKVFEVVAFG